MCARSKIYANELTFKTETDSQTQRTDLVVTGEGVGERWIGSVSLAAANYYI